MKKITAAVVLLLSLTAHAAVAQTEKLGVVQYTPVGGWAKTSKPNIVAFSESDPATGKFCVISLFGATPGAGSPQRDFAREWNNLVVTTFKVGANPKTETASAEGWTVVGGGSEVAAGGGKAVAVLTVISGFGKTVSVLGVFNDSAYASRLDSFVSAIEIDKADAPANSAASAAPPALDGDGTSSSRSPRANST
jgi:hypothetical protein